MLRLLAGKRFFAKRPSKVQTLPQQPPQTSPFIAFKLEKQQLAATQNIPVEKDALKTEWQKLKTEERRKYKIQAANSLLGLRNEVKKILRMEKPIVGVPTVNARSKYFYTNYAKFAKAHPTLSASELKEAITKAFAELPPAEKRRYSVAGSEKYLMVELDKKTLETGLKNLEAFRKHTVSAYNMYIKENCGAGGGKEAFGKVSELSKRWGGLSDAEKEKYQLKAEKMTRNIEISPVDFEGQLLQVCAVLEERLGPNWLSLRARPLERLNATKTAYTQFVQDQTDIWADKSMSAPEKIKKIAQRYRESKVGNS